VSEPSDRKPPPDAGDASVPERGTRAGPPAEQEQGGRAIGREEFEVVIRRAAELALSAETEGEDRLSEAEIVRIGGELGLPAHHVRQALYELPELHSEESMFGRVFGPAVVSAARPIPGDAALLLRRIEDYLVTREYLQVVRRRPDRVFFMPADDTLSALARGLTRPGSRFHLARARRAALSSRALGDGRTHVQIATDFSDQRRQGIRAAVAAGVLGGLVLGGAGAAAVTAIGMPGVFETTGQVLAAAAGLAGGVYVSVRSTAARFRARMQAARVELEGLLDRAEQGERLEPPPAPWRRRLQMRFLGHGDG
jgi:hypothetical protein